MHREPEVNAMMCLRLKPAEADVGFHVEPWPPSRLRVSQQSWVRVSLQMIYLSQGNETRHSGCLKSRERFHFPENVAQMPTGSTYKPVQRSGYCHCVWRDNIPKGQRGSM